MTYVTDIKSLHHNAYRCRDSEETRQFYEDFLGLRLASSLHYKESKTGRTVEFLHTFYEMNDSSFLAFFEVPEGQEESFFKQRSDFDLHIALEIESREQLEAFKKRGEEQGMKVRGISDHGFIHSIYFTDPNGYVVELTAKDQNYDAIMEAELQQAHEVLENWQRQKALISRERSPESAALA